jgi:serine protease Do
MHQNMSKIPSFKMIAAIAACVVSWSPSLLPAQSGTGLPDLRKLEQQVQAVVSQAMPATVSLMSKDSGSSGSGVIVSADGLIYTAAHVIQGADDVMVVFPDGKQERGKVLGANYSKDIAMVKLTQPGPWPFVKTGSSKPLQAGDWVVALGHSAGFDPARTPPVRFGRVISKGPGNFLTTDCTLIGGDSGGPLFGLDGSLIGIHSSIGRSLSNNNHAGIDGFRDDESRLLAGEAWGRLSLNPFANPEMPVLGISMEMMRGVKGVIVEGVVPDSPAAAAGVRTGDVITAIGDADVEDGAKLLKLLAKKQPGDTVKLKLVRDQNERVVDVTLKRRNELFADR